MLVKRDVMCGLTVAREFWIHVSDSDDSDSSDDDTNQGGRGRKQRGLFREVNPPPDGYDSDSSDDGYYPDSDSCMLQDGCPFKIYPGPDLEQCRYRHAHLRHFSQKAIKQYNHQTGNGFEFVELIEASVHRIVGAAYIEVIFKACQSDDPMVTTSLKQRLALPLDP